MKKSDYLFILISFVIWRVAIIIIAFFAIKNIPIFSQNYFGGGFSTYQTNPIFWGHLNFDGEHYLSIAQSGYKPLEYFFFPVFPRLIQIISSGKPLIDLAWTGLFVSNISFLAALMGMYKLIKIDFDVKVAKVNTILFLVFPTSFYFGTYYTESIFLALVVWTFYFARTKNYIFASILASVASATRVIGLVLLPVLLIEWFFDKKKNILNFFEIIFISPIGLVTYMYYLLKQTGDPLIFLHQVSIFGEQRSSTLVTLPQVFYRYLFEILPHVSYSYFPNVFTTYLEFLMAVIFLILILICFFNLRLSYSVYALFAFLIPAFAGSFSSMPRYVLAMFPIFILSAIYISRIPKVYKYVIYFGMIVLFVAAEGLFWRGYWLS